MYKIISLFRWSNRSRRWCCESEMSELPRTVELSVNSRRCSIGSAAELMTSRFKRQVAITRFKIIVSPRTCEHELLQGELERQRNWKRILGEKASHSGGQGRPVWSGGLKRQTWSFLAKSISIQVDQQNRHLAQEVEDLTKKNEFLFGEIAKERVTENIPK